MGVYGTFASLSGVNVSQKGKGKARSFVGYDVVFTLP